MTNDEWTHWQKSVDKICVSALGLSTESLPDFKWRQLFYSNHSPWEAVNDAVAYWKDDDPEVESAWNLYIIREIPYG